LKTVLIVDDEFGITDALREILSDEGFHVLVARNGKDGLKRIEERRPDLIVLDYMMPVMDGRETLLALQANPATASIPVILISAMPEASIPTDCMGATFLRKPFRVNRLLSEIRQLLDTAAPAAATGRPVHEH
jgi:CheY-like chemotaxis protein